MHYLQSALESIIGTYHPTLANAVYYDAVNNVTITYQTVPSGAAGVDWVWVGACSILIIVIYSLFRFFGGLFK